MRDALDILNSFGEIELCVRGQLRHDEYIYDINSRSKGYFLGSTPPTSGTTVTVKEGHNKPTKPYQCVIKEGNMDMILIQVIIINVLHFQPSITENLKLRSSEHHD